MTQQSVVSGVVKNNMSHPSTAPCVRDAGVVYPSLNLVSEMENMGYLIALPCTVAAFGNLSTKTYDLPPHPSCPA